MQNQRGFVFLFLRKRKMLVTHLGKPFKSSGAQLAISVYFAKDWSETTSPEAQFETSSNQLYIISKDIEKKDEAQILQTPYFANLIKYEFHSLDHCFARLSLFAYSRTAVWTICIPNHGYYTVLANDKQPLEPICKLFVPATGDLHVFKGGLNEAKGFLENAAPAAPAAPLGAAAIYAYVWRTEEKAVEIKKEPIQEEATPPMPDIVETPKAVAAVETPAAPVKKKAVRKRPQPTTAVAEDASTVKKPATEVKSGGAE